MSVSRRQPTRRAVLGTGGAVGLATLLTIGARDAVAHAEADGAAFTRTNEVALRADDPTLSDRARGAVAGSAGGGEDAVVPGVDTGGLRGSGGRGSRGVSAPDRPRSPDGAGRRGGGGSGPTGPSSRA